MIRIAAIADLHFGDDAAGTLRPHLEHVGEQADVFLLAGDLTRHGDPEEAQVLAKELRDVTIPKIAVLGNHDHHCDKAYEIAAVMEEIGFQVLEGDATVVEVEDTTLGIAGAKGFGGGFLGACASDFGEPEMKAFVRHTKEVSERIEGALEQVRQADHRIALLHYSPCEQTLQGERLEIYPFLGSYLLGEAVDRAGADLVVHGHAHRGTEKGVTAGGIHVRNVAETVIRRAYNVYALNEEAAGGRRASAGRNSSRPS